MEREGVATQGIVTDPAAPDRPRDPRRARRGHLPADLLPRQLRRHGARRETTSTRPSSPRPAPSSSPARISRARTPPPRRRRRSASPRRTAARWCSTSITAPTSGALLGHGAGEARYVRSDARHGASASRSSPIATSSSARRRSCTSPAARRTRSRRSAPSARVSTATIVCKRGPMGCVVFPGRDPGLARGRREGPRLPGRGLQRARRGRRLPVRLPARLAARRAARDLLRLRQCLRRLRGLAPALLAGDPDLPRAAALPRSTAAATRRCATTRTSTTSTGRRRAGPRARHAHGARHRPPHAARGDGGGGRRAASSASPTSRCWPSRPRRGWPDGRPGFGMLIDGTYGREALFRAADHPFWIGRPVELPGSRPLDFEGGGRLGAQARRNGRSAHTIKCLCFYHPDDPPELKAAAGARAASPLRRRAHASAASCWSRSSPASTGRSRPTRSPASCSASTISASSRTGGSSSRSADEAAWHAIGDVIDAERSLLPRHRAARPRSAGGRAGGSLRRRRQGAAGEGLCGRPHDLQRRRAALAQGRDRPTRPPSPTWPPVSSASSMPGSRCRPARRRPNAKGGACSRPCPLSMNAKT